MPHQIFTTKPLQDALIMVHTTTWQRPGFLYFRQSSLTDYKNPLSLIRSRILKRSISLFWNRPVGSTSESYALSLLYRTIIAC